MIRVNTPVARVYPAAQQESPSKHPNGSRSPEVVAMGKMPRFVLIALGAVVALILLVAVCLPLFLNADSFRTRIESTLTKSLGRKVSIGKLELSVWSGGLVASNTSVADDPAFSSQPFIQADSVKIGVDIIPLVLG